LEDEKPLNSSGKSELVAIPQPVPCHMQNTHQKK